MNPHRFGELFKPGKIGMMEIPNRLVMPPIGTEYATTDGFVTARLKDYYEARARGGVGLIIVEVTCIDSPGGICIRSNLCLDHDAYLPGMAELVAVIHRHGAKAAIQLCHAGVSTHRSYTGVQPAGPSALRAFTGDMSRALSRPEIERLVERFAEAAQRAKRAGFDAVEIHGATNYLVAQFLSGYWNRREDEYGGSLENRARFLLEVLRAARDKVGKDFPLWFRINLTEFGLEGGMTLDEATQIAVWGEAAGSNAVHVSSFGARNQAHMGPCVADRGVLLPLTRRLKQAVGVPVIGVGHIDGFRAQRALENGEADFIAIGRGLLADADFADKLREDRPEDIRPCICCLDCIRCIIYKGKALKCAVNPLCGKEGEYRIEPAGVKKHVVVIGGGPAGMEAARVAAIRGHRVCLFEKESRLGGLLRSACRPPGKADIERLVEYLIIQLEKTGVEIFMSNEIGPEAVAGLNPDAVIVACGASPALPDALGLPDIRGLNDAEPIRVEDALLGKMEIGQRVLVVGGRRNGCETAEFLSKAGKTVTIVHRSNRPAPDVLPVFRTPLLSRLKQHGVTLHRGIRGGKIEQKRFIGHGADNPETIIDFDTLIVTGSRKPRKIEWGALESSVQDLLVIGDAAGARGIMEAVAEGNRAGRRV